MCLCLLNFQDPQHPPFSNRDPQHTQFSKKIEAPNLNSKIALILTSLSFSLFLPGGCHCTATSIFALINRKLSDHCSKLCTTGIRKLNCSTKEVYHMQTLR